MYSNHRCICEEYISFPFTPLRKWVKNCDNQLFACNTGNSMAPKATAPTLKSWHCADLHHLATWDGAACFPHTKKIPSLRLVLYGKKKKKKKDNSTVPPFDIAKMALSSTKFILENCEIKSHTQAKVTTTIINNFKWVYYFCWAVLLAVPGGTGHQLHMAERQKATL